MDPLLRLARNPRPLAPSDYLAAGFVMAWALLEAIVAEGPGSTPARIGFALVISLPLLVRRRAPLAVIVVISVATVAWALAADRGESGTMPFPAILLALFSVALYARTAAVAVGGGLVAFAAMAITLQTPFYDAEPTAGNLAILCFFSAGTWTAGWLVRRRATQLRRAYEESGDMARGAVADERARIARELHDVVAHSVSVIAVQAGAAEQLLGQDPAAAREHLAAVRRTARETMTEMRRLLGVLREDDVGYAPLPGLARLPDLLEEVRRAGLVVDLVESGERRELPPAIDLVAYRLIQESLTNARKHAGGAPAQVAVAYGARELGIEVTNPLRVNGRAPRAGGGHGLIGMRERVRIFDGDFDAGATADGGFRVRARLPLGEDAT